jgi:hypothetical protein
MGTGKPQVRWLVVVTRYPCTRCGAAPGELCRTDSGTNTYTPHADRSALASEDGWADPDQESRP